MEHTAVSVKGLVHSTNSSFGYFEVKDNIKVHMSVILAQKVDKKLPECGTLVEIEKAHKFGSTYVACKSSLPTMKGDFVKNCGPSSILNLIIEHKFGATDIIKLDEIIRRVEENFTNLNEEIKYEMYLGLLQKIVAISKVKQLATIGREDCCNAIISEVTVDTINSCKYVEILTDKYSDFPYWSFGIHPSKDTTVLFGYLEIHPLYGFYMIKDKNYQMVLVITTEDCKKTDFDVSKFRDSFVLIENYTVINEIFKESRVPNLEYIVTNVDSITVIQHTKAIVSAFGAKFEEAELPNSLSFVHIKKSTVCVGINNSSKFLLQVFVRFKSAKLLWEEIYLVLPSVHIHLHMAFKEGSLYMMHYKTPLKLIKHLELARIKNLSVYEVTDKDCYFQPVDVKMYNIPKPLSIQECKLNIENNNSLISFRGIVVQKRFVDPLSSRTVKNSTMYGFGTPGEKVHQVVFCHVKDKTKLYLDCYLNNWENKLMPLGLIPQMEVIVRNVLPQSKKYLKSTILTTFEIVSYNPESPFNTVNLYMFDKENWGVPSVLSQGTKMPVGVLVWGHVHNIFLIKLTFNLRCANCKEPPNSASHRNLCKQSEIQVELSARFHADDHLGQSSVFTKSPEVLQAILGMNKRSFDDWITHFCREGCYSYNFFDGVEHSGSTKCEEFTEFLKKLTRTKPWLHLKCRKLKSSTSVDHRAPWFCVDAMRL